MKYNETKTILNRLENSLRKNEMVLMIYATLALAMQFVITLIVTKESGSALSIVMIVMLFAIFTFAYAVISGIRKKDLISSGFVSQKNSDTLIEVIKDALQDRGCNEHEDKRYKKIYSKFNDDNVILIQDFRWLVAYLKVNDTLEKKKSLLF
ncbi:hypothetical protein NI385_25850 (plasmid) [Vibrio parahaemolyticus]|nr:hypothetical protein NI385_25850 [Vibrio parahaemolyticus]